MKRRRVRLVLGRGILLAFMALQVAEGVAAFAETSVAGWFGVGLLTGFWLTVIADWLLDVELRP